MNSTDPLLEVVREMIADVLALEIDEVHPEDSFFQELQGDSLALLELGFKCEKLLGVKIHFQRLFPEEQLPTDAQDVLTPEALALLGRQFPLLDLKRIADQPLKNRLPELLTVDAITHIVRRAVDAKEQLMPTDPLPSLHT